jgi:putative FmdB family regulatory protein
MREQFRAMPLYEYKCRQCGKTFEALEKFSDPPLTKHAACGGAVERLISSSTFQLKGSGWYATDYPKGKGKRRNGKSGSSEKSETPAPKPAESKPSTGSEPAAKS